MFAQLVTLFTAQPGHAGQQEADAVPPASLTFRQFCKSCRRTPAAHCGQCRTWRRDYASVRACLLAPWPAHYRRTDSVTLRLRVSAGVITETGTEAHVKEYRSLLCLAGVGQEC